MKKPNIVLIVADALRYDRLGCYGNKKKFTPNIDKLSEEGILFTNCYSSSTWTFPAVASLFTSFLPDVHLLKDVISGDGNSFSADILNPQFKTIASILKEKGYFTFSAVTNPWLRNFFQITRGFEEKFYSKKIDAAKLTDIFLKRVKELKYTPFFYYLHYMDCHAPFNMRIDGGKYSDIAEKLEFPLTYKYFRKNFKNLTEREVEFLNEIYDGEVKHLDSNLKKIFSEFRDSIIIFTSDHGEFLGERGYHPIVKDRVIAFGHNKTPYEELIKVPLIIKIPGQFKGVQIDEYVHHIDILPTLLQLLEIKEKEKFQGKSLIPLLKGNKNPYFETAYSIKYEGRYFNTVERCVVHRGKKLIQFLTPEKSFMEPFSEKSFHPVNFSFDNYFTLLGYKISKKELKRGESFWIKLYFLCNRDMKNENGLFMLLFQNSKNLKVPIIEKHFPQYGMKIIPDWKEGDIIEDSFAYMIPESISPGEYNLRIGLYDLNKDIKSEDVEDKFLGPAKTFGKIKIKEDIFKMESHLLRGKYLRKILSLITGYPTKFKIIDESRKFKRGETILVKLRHKGIKFKKRLRRIQFKLFPKNKYPLIFFENKGFRVESCGKISASEEIYPLTIPPYLKKGIYRLKVSILPKAMRKPKWNFTYHHLTDIEIDGETEEAIDENIIFCGFNLKSDFSNEGGIIKGEILMNVFDETQKTLPLKVKLLSGDGNNYILYSGDVEICVSKIPYHGFLTLSKEISLKIDKNFKKGKYTLSVEIGNKSINSYKINIFEDLPEQDLLREEFYYLNDKDGEMKNRIDDVDSKTIKFMREKIKLQFRESVKFRKEKGINGKRDRLEDEVIKELKDLGYF